MYFERFVSLVVQEYKDYVTFWLTINEPVVYVFGTYVAGLFPPGRRSFWRAFKVYRNLVIAHVKAYDLIKSLSKKAKVSLVHQQAVFDPYESSYASRKVCSLMTYLFNNLFLDSIFSGKLLFPLSIYGRIPQGKIDFIGLDYYYRFQVKITKSNRGLPSYIPLDVFVPKESYSKQFGFELYPKGIYRILKNLKKYRKPIYITENGVATDDERQRMDFIVSHLREISKAMVEGVDVRGYSHWTLFDDFEFNFGYHCRFGLMTKKKKPKESYYLYRDICKKKEIREEIMKKYAKEENNNS